MLKFILPSRSSVCLAKFSKRSFVQIRGDGVQHVPYDYDDDQDDDGGGGEKIEHSSVHLG